MLEKRICEYCGKTFEVPSYSPSRFCGKKCWYSFAKGGKVGKYSEQRVKATQDARKKEYLKRNLKYTKRIEKMISEGYVCSPGAYAKLLGINEHTIYKIISEKDKKIIINKRLPQTVYTRFSLEDFIKLREKIKKVEGMQDIHDLHKEYGLTKETLYQLRYLITGISSKLGRPRQQTYPEAFFEDILKCEGFCYEKEVKIPAEQQDHFYLIDFVVEGKLAVEIQGDYWHGNPLKYKGEDLNEMQIRNKIRDSKKLLKMKEVYPEVLIVWENDLKKSWQKVSRRLHEKYNNAGNV